VHKIAPAFHTDLVYRIVQITFSQLWETPVFCSDNFWQDKTVFVGRGTFPLLRTPFAFETILIISFMISAAMGVFMWRKKMFQDFFLEVLLNPCEGGMSCLIVATVSCTSEKPE
jgi:hypothetical protein